MLSDSAMLGILIQAGVGIATIATIKNDVKWIKERLKAEMEAVKDEVKELKERLTKLENRKC